MPTVPGQPADPAQPKPDPTMLAIAAADMHKAGRLFAPVPLPKPKPEPESKPRLDW